MYLDLFIVATRIPYVRSLQKSVSNFSVFLRIVQKSEICISGMAISSRHSLPTQPKVEEKRAWFNNIQFQNRRHKQFTNVRTGGLNGRGVAEESPIPGSSLFLLRARCIALHWTSD
jgi:hypothetical protein